MKIQIRVDPERLTVADLLAIEEAQEGKRANHCMVSLITHSMVDEQGQWLEVAQAFQALKQLLGRILERSCLHILQQFLYRQAKNYKRGGIDRF